MDRKTPNEERYRQEEPQTSSPNPAPNEGHTANRSINETAEGYNITPVQNDLPAPPAATNPTEEGHVQASNPMPDVNITHGAMVDQLPIEESVDDEHDERDLIAPVQL